MKLSLNLNNPTDQLQAVQERVKVATEKVKKAKKEVVPLNVAWEQIKEKKNSEPDIKKLGEVYHAMKDGVIGREQGKEDKTFTKAEAIRLWKVLQEITREQKLDELTANTPDNYILVNTVEKAMAMFQVLRMEKIIAVDTETTGVNVYVDKMVGISFTAPTADLHYYIPVRHTTGERQLTWVGQDGISGLHFPIKNLLEDESIEKVFHNAIFDLHVFEGEGIKVKGKVHDTLVLMNLLNENEGLEGGSFRLKDLVTKYLKIESDTFDVLFGKDCRFDTVPFKYALFYAAKDTHVTWLLYQFQLKHLSSPSLEKVLDYYYKVEQPLIQVVVDMERVGFILDMEEVEKQRVELNLRKGELETELLLHFGDINFGSPTQLAKVLYEDKKLGKHLGYKKKQSTDTATMKVLAKYDEGCKLLLEYRNISKQLSSFVESLPNNVQPDGKIHGSFKANGTVTGRFSSIAPNLQQQSKPARKMFRVEDTHTIVASDWSAQEIRMLAHLTNDPFLIDIYKKDLDFYSMVASKVFDLPIEECLNDSLPRKKIKVVVLGLLYGMATKTLAENLGIMEIEAQKIVDDFFANFSKVKEFMDNNIAFCKKHGYVEMIMGRKRRLPQINSGDRWEQLRAQRQAAANSPIQGSSAIQTKVTMIELDKLCKRLSKGERTFHLLCVVHDEALTKCPKDVTPYELSLINGAMVNSLPLNVPSKSDFEIGNCWGVMEKIEVASL